MPIRPSHLKRLRVLHGNKMEKNQTPFKLRILLTVLLILTLNLAGCEEEVPPPETVIPLVKTELVQADPRASNTKLFNAITSGIDTPTVSFRVSGTLETVTGKVGDLPVIDLLDSQSRLILSKTNAARTRFQFFKDLFSLFRTVGRTELIANFKNEEKLKEFKRQVEQHFQKKASDKFDRNKPMPKG